MAIKPILLFVLLNNSHEFSFTIEGEQIASTYIHLSFGELFSSLIGGVIRIRDKQRIAWIKTASSGEKTILTLFDFTTTYSK